jgi:polyketide cyclase/dehydrase/lipid transport protein
LIAAEAPVSASAREVFAFLADLENHWLLTGPLVRVLHLSGPAGARDGGTVRIGGPLGLGRSARTKVVEAHEPESMSGRAEIGKRTRAAVRWTIAERPDGCRVRLQATVERAGPLDRVILALGGRWLMRRLFARTVRELARRFNAY